MTYDNDPDREPRLSDPVVRGDEQSGMTMMGIVAAIAVALIVGLVYFNMGDETSSTATYTNTSSGVTAGSSPPSPPSGGDKAAPQTGKQP
jgi:cell division protein FtsN